MSEATKQAIVVAQKLLKSYESIDFFNYPLLSYSRWAADEIIHELEMNKDIPPLIILEEFRNKMDDYACENLRNSFIFSEAYDVVTIIIDELLE